MKPTQTTLLVFLLLTSFRFDLNAQWITYNNINTVGIGGNLVTSIEKNTSGTIWFGTDQGLTKFDPQNNIFTNYSSTSAVPNKMIFDVDIYSSSVWAGTNGGGACVYNGSSWTTFDESDGLCNNIVRGVACLNNSTTWFATYGGGISRKVNNTWTTFNTGTGLPTNFFYCVSHDSQGGLWFGTSGHGVVRYKNGIWTTFTIANGLAGNSVIDICEDNNGDIICAGENGVSIYDGTNWETVTVNQGLSDNLVYCSRRFSDNRLWMATDMGVNVWDGTTMDTLTTADGLAENKVMSLMEDNLTGQWFGHVSIGTTRHTGNHWIHYPASSGTLSNTFYKTCEDTNGNLWFRNYYSICRFNGVSWVTYNSSSGLPNGYVYDICADHSGNVWASISGYGLAKYDGSQWTVYNTSCGLKSNYIYDIFVDSQNTLWVGYGYNYGISRFNGTTCTNHYTTLDGLISNYVNCFFEDAQQNLWIGTSNGVSRFKNNVWTNFTSSNGLNSQSAYVYDIAQTTSGEICFAQGSYGVTRYDGLYWTYTQVPGLSNVRAVMGDSYGSLWAGGNGDYSHNYNVSRLSGSTWSSFPTSTINNIYAYHLFEDSQHRLWASTSNGASYLYLSSLDVEQPSIPEVPILSNFPNPFSDFTTIPYTLKKTGKTHWVLYNTNGSVVHEQDLGVLIAGDHEFVFHADKLPTGVYFYKIYSGSQVLNGKLNVIH